MKVLAGIILYNSDYPKMLECIESLHDQVDKIILWDNSPQIFTKQQIEELDKYPKCEYIFANDNLGMPEGLNRVVEIADKQGYEWVLTMNADSICPENMIEEYASFFEDDNIGMICPQVIDKRRKYMKISSKMGHELVDMCITSAACTNVKAWRQVGKFDGWLLVDLLDNDISKRMILNGWKIVKVNSVVLDQEFGDIKPKGKKEEQFWLWVGKLLHNDNFAKLSYKKTVHPNRVYYTCRNIIYLNKKFKNYGGIGYRENYNCNTFVGFLICFVLPSIIRADEKMKTIKAVIKGFKDGVTCDVTVFRAVKHN